MADEHLLSRREFTLESALAILTAATITITGCGDDDDDPGTGPSGQAGTRTGNVSANHGHVASVTAVQITAANSISVDIRGSADHPHTIQLTGPQLTTIGANGQVSVVSTTDAAHNHTVTFN